MSSWDEKIWGSTQSENQMEKFGKALEVGELYDLGQQGSKYTQSNRHKKKTFTKEILDRGVDRLIYLYFHILLCIRYASFSLFYILFYLFLFNFYYLYK